jgi:hypothetical protein
VHELTFTPTPTHLILNPCFPKSIFKSVANQSQIIWKNRNYHLTTGFLVLSSQVMVSHLVTSNVGDLKKSFQDRHPNINHHHEDQPHCKIPRIVHFSARRNFNGKTTLNKPSTNDFYFYKNSPGEIHWLWIFWQWEKTAFQRNFGFFGIRWGREVSIGRDSPLRKTSHTSKRKGAN